MHRFLRLTLVAVVLRVLGGFGASPAAADLPPVREADRALTSVPGQPNAPAAVLFNNAEFWMRDFSRQEASSRLRVQVRVKILTDAGISRGEVLIPHSRWVRLQNFQGRTTLPDGRVVPVPTDAQFVRKLSRRQKRFVTAVAFPAVAAGAILDYEYELRFDSFFLLEPWFFSDEIPVLHSEILYHVPANLEVQGWNRDPFQVGVKSEKAEDVRGVRLRLWADNLPAIPDEPLSFPFRDLATQAMLLPTNYRDGVATTALMADWKSTSRLLLDSYDQARRGDGAVVRKARELTAPAGSPPLAPREKAAVLFRFVRDRISTDDEEGPSVEDGVSVDDILRRGHGDSAAKSVLLLALFAAVKIEAQPVWTASRSQGIPDLQLASPGWFDRVIVAARVDSPGGPRVFFDPSDRALGPGFLAPGTEGTQGLIPDRKKPEIVDLPVTPIEQSVRKVSFDLALDAAGRLTGKGRIDLSGHHAWARIGWKGESATSPEAWTRWLEDRSKGFKIADLTLEESADERRVTVTWNLAQREEAVLGDEVSLVPSRPVGPTPQRFTLPPDKRRTPVFFDFADRDELELRLAWPEGWQVEVAPEPVKVASAVGAFTVEVRRDDAGRRLTYRRQFDITQRQLNSSALYAAIQSLYGAVERSDAQSLALIRP